MSCTISTVPTIPLPALQAQCRACGLDAPEPILAPLSTYLALLMRWNTAMNLVGTRTWQDTLRRLVVDSFHLADMLAKTPLPSQPVTWDMGAGAGLPGLPLRMLWQDGQYTLIEARAKRAYFMQTALAHLDLPRTQVFHGRVEDYCARQDSADICISRAFMPWTQLLDFVLPYLQQDSYVLCMTRTPLPARLPAQWRVAMTKEYTVDSDSRWLWLLQAPPLFA